MERVRTSQLQQALEIVQELSPEEQELLLEIAYHRFIEQRRTGMAGEVTAARQAYRLGQVQRGTAQELMAECEKKRCPQR